MLYIYYEYERNNPRCVFCTPVPSGVTPLLDRCRAWAGPCLEGTRPHMFYPFPRQAQRCAPPPAPCVPAVAAAQPPAPMAWPQQHASPPAPTGWPPQRSDQPSGWPPEEDGAASSLDDHGSDDGEELVFNDEFLLGFVASEGSDVSSRASRRAAAGPAASNSALPQREDEASRAAQREARQRRQQQELRYGPRAPEVRALEAALNERFDRVSQAHAPALWPSVPFS